MSEILLATDLDETLVGDDKATYELNEIIIALKATKGLKLAYVTGRSPELYAQLQEQKSLLIPDALVTAVGSEINVNGEKQTDWPIAPGWDIAVLKQLLSLYPDLQLQPPTEQRQHKLSFLLNQNPALVNEIRNQLAEQPVDVIYSMGQYLDILPKGVNKGSALIYLVLKWGISPNNVYACGDSGNDISMLACSRPIVVGNARSELLRWADSQPQRPFVAQASYANGIIEGLKHYQVVQ